MPKTGHSDGSDLRRRQRSRRRLAAAAGPPLGWVDLGHGLGWRRPRWLVPAGPEVQVDPAALEFELVDLAFAVVLAAGLEGQDLQVTGKVLKLGQQVSYRHALSVAHRAL